MFWHPIDSNGCCKFTEENQRHANHCIICTVFFGLQGCMKMILLNFSKMLFRTKVSIYTAKTTQQLLSKALVWCPRLLPTKEMNVWLYGICMTCLTCFSISCKQIFICPIMWTPKKYVSAFQWWLGLRNVRGACHSQAMVEVTTISVTKPEFSPYTGRTKVMLLESCTANPFPLESFCQHDSGQHGSGQFPPR